MPPGSRWSSHTLLCSAPPAAQGTGGSEDGARPGHGVDPSQTRWVAQVPPDHHHHDSSARVPRLEQNPQGQAQRAHSTKTCECFISVANYGTCESPGVSNRLGFVSQSAAVSLRHPQDRASARLPESGMQGCRLGTPLNGRSQASWQRRPDPHGAGIDLLP